MSHEPSLGRGVPDEGWPRRIRTALAALLEPSDAPTPVVTHPGSIFDQLPDSRLLDRISEQLSFAAAEVRRDPAGFAAALLAPDFADSRSLRRVQALEVAALLAGVALLFLVLSTTSPRETLPSHDTDRSPVTRLAIPPIGGGGGGSGSNDPAPVSRGVRPQSSLADPIAPATAKPIRTPLDPLPIPPPIKAPTLPPHLVEQGAFGVPLGPDGPSSNGPGRGGGVGTGDGEGFGKGKGKGFGPGDDFGAGGETPSPRLTEKAPAVAPVVLNSPRPAYTEEARRDKTQGDVFVKVLFGADGRIRQARVERGLPNGLDAKAIEAVYRFVFRPARNVRGEPVDAWVTVKVRFTIR